MEKFKRKVLFLHKYMIAFYWLDKSIYIQSGTFY